LKTKIHYFSKTEFSRLLPPRLLDYLVKAGKEHESHTAGAPNDLYQLPVGNDFPVFLVARMSLSFPGLIQAVPLYRYDDQLRDDANKATLRRCLFSDGGISSNFPIHFFDKLVPTRPTFGIALGERDQQRHGCERFSGPHTSITSSNLPVRNITSLSGFLMAMFNTAKDWQDTIQATLPGYADRIVTVLLDGSDEGGLNLNMPFEKVTELSDLGTGAADRLSGKFSYSQHTYNRALTVFPPLEDGLRGFAKIYYSSELPDGESYHDILVRFETNDYAGNTNAWRENGLAPFVREIAEIGRKAETPPTGQMRVRDGEHLPQADCQVRPVATADRVPKSYEARESLS